jgi:hypothetical protein
MPPVENPLHPPGRPLWRLAITVVLWGSFAFFLLLSVLAVRELAGDTSCPTGEFDTAEVKRLQTEWLPPSLLCEVTLTDGETHQARTQYWPAFAGAAATGATATWWTRRESKTKANTTESGTDHE